MITDLKIYLIFMLVVWQGIAQWQIHSVKTEYREYKESINDQLQQAKDEKARIESEQLEKFNKAKLDYSDTSKRLGDALKRLRDAQIMSGNCTLPMAGNSVNTMSRTAENPTRTIDPAETAAGIRQTAFYAMSMQETLQCSSLISLVKTPK